VRLVLVEWLDSRRGEGWTRLEDLPADLQAVRCKSAGWIIAEDDSSVTLAGHLGDNPEQCCGDITIPSRAILSIRLLSLCRKQRTKGRFNTASRKNRETVRRTDSALGD
jgi:hypothetical protein